MSTRIQIQRGFTLLIAIIISSVALSIGLALLDIAYKQLVLAGSARQSGTAFYNADGALECGLYWDQQQNAFDYTAPISLGSITCNTLTVQNASTSVSGGVRTTSFTIPCSGEGTSGVVSIYKTSTSTTQIYATGYNTCNTSDPRRTERALRANYGGSN